jgi:peptidyl-prolyl cis-trans isomerase C
MKRLTLCAVLALAVMGCKDRPEKKAPASPPPEPTVALPSDREIDPDAVLVEVNGTKFTGKDAELEVAMRIQSLGQRIPPDRMKEVRQKVLGEVVRQFVMRTLLLQECDRAKVDVTAEDEAKAYASIATNLPPGSTLEQVMKESPIGEKRMRAEVTNGLRINKLLAAHFTNQLEVADKDVDEFIEKNKERMAIPESVQARHILLATTTNDSEAVRAEKKQKAEKLREELVAGADFAKVALDNSDCPSKAKGGDLGKFGRGQMVKPFEDAAFGQDVNAVGPVIETQFGYHIIQVTEHSKAGEVPREDIANMLKGRKQQKLLIEFVEELKSKATIVGGNSAEDMPPMRMPAPQPKE